MGIRHNWPNTQPTERSQPGQEQGSLSQGRPTADTSIIQSWAQQLPLNSLSKHLANDCVVTQPSYFPRREEGPAWVPTAGEQLKHALLYGPRTELQLLPSSTPTGHR